MDAPKRFRSINVVNNIMNSLQFIASTAAAMYHVSTQRACRTFIY